MSFSAPRIEDRLRQAIPGLTPAERKLVSHILDHYPVAALASITALAKAADVSSPTVVRLAQKIGFKGYPDLQQTLRIEVEEMLASPVSKREKWSGRAPEAHILNRFSAQVMENLSATMAGISPDTFDAAAVLLADPERRIYVMGGRITHALAEYFATLSRVIRPDVTLLSGLSNAWPPGLLDMRAGDVLLIFDIRRYENTVLQVAELAAEQGAEVVLITDRWVSPAGRHARHVLAAHVEAPSAWDSTVPLLVLVETLLAAMQDLRWAETEARLNRMEALSERARFFRRFRDV
jgi:DNA-binding MurR/RpiR family transcriptional regulator